MATMKQPDPQTEVPEVVEGETIPVFDTAIIPQESALQLGVLRVSGPVQALTLASEIATPLAKIIKDRKLFTTISGRDHVHVEGWTTMGAMMGILPREVSCEGDGAGNYTAYVELIRVSDGAVVGGASNSCGMDEPTWKSRSEYTRRSMAVTRATGKAFRLGFSWIMVLAGYSPTPAEEMPHENQEPEPHWTENAKWVEKAYQSADEKYGMEREQVHIAAGVQHLRQFRESPEALKQCMAAYAAGRDQMMTLFSAHNTGEIEVASEAHYDGEGDSDTRY